MPAPSERAKGLGGGRHRALPQGMFLLLQNPAAPASAGGNRKQSECCQRKGHPNKRDKNGEIPEGRSVLGAGERDE